MAERMRRGLAFRVILTRPRIKEMKATLQLHLARSCPWQCPPSVAPVLGHLNGQCVPPWAHYEDYNLQFPPTEEWKQINSAH